MNTPSSYSLSEYTKAQIERLAAAHRLTKSTVIALAVDRFFAQTMGEHGENDPNIDHARAKEYRDSEEK